MFLRWLKKIAPNKEITGYSSLISFPEGYAPPSQDTLTAIAELSKVVKNNPDTIEIYLALGNLYRSHGEIERAVQIRNNLIVRPNLAPRYKARALYELGLDYRRGGFFDRAHHALDQARQIVGDEPDIIEGLASLAALSRDWEQAARYYALLAKPIPEAHYWVRLAQENWAKGYKAESKKWLQKSLRVYPGAVEAWLEYLVRDYNQQDWESLAKDFEKALQKIIPGLRFVLLEGLIQHGLLNDDISEEDSATCLDPKATEALLPILKEQSLDSLLTYYGAWLLSRSGDLYSAKTWLEKTLLMDKDFWPARLELLSMSMADQELSPVFKLQLDFFIKRAKNVERFICKKCGLKRNRIFFVCPKCQSWYSIAFRNDLSS